MNAIFKLIKIVSVIGRNKIVWEIYAIYNEKLHSMKEWNCNKILNTIFFGWVFKMQQLLERQIYVVTIMKCKKQKQANCL